MPGIGYAIIAFAAPEHPRSESASFVELADGVRAASVDIDWFYR